MVRHGILKVGRRNHLDAKVDYIRSQTYACRPIAGEKPSKPTSKRHYQLKEQEKGTLLPGKPRKIASKARTK